MKRTRISPHRAWFGLFGLWAFFLTGILSGFFGGPGMIQAIRLQNLLHGKLTQLDSLQSQLNLLQSEAESIEKSPAVQQREIRRVLGYAAPDELIFDFSSGTSI